MGLLSCHEGEGDASGPLVLSSSSAIAAWLQRGSATAARVPEERPHAERTSMHDCPGRSNQPTNIINNAKQSSLGSNRTFRSQASTDYLFIDAVPDGPECFQWHSESIWRETHPNTWISKSVIRPSNPCALRNVEWVRAPWFQSWIFYKVWWRAHAISVSQLYLLPNHLVFRHEPINGNVWTGNLVNMQRLNFATWRRILNNGQEISNIAQIPNWVITMLSDAFLA